MTTPRSSSTRFATSEPEDASRPGAIGVGPALVDSSRPDRRCSSRGIESSEAGFTLIESVVAAGLLAVGIVLTLAVVVGLGDQSSAELSRVSLDQALTNVHGQLERDVDAAQPCASHRAVPIIHEIAEGRLAWTIDPDGDGSAELVEWQMTGGQIQRRTFGPTSSTTPCTFGATTTNAQVLMAGVRPAPVVEEGPPENPRSTAFAVTAPDGDYPDSSVSCVDREAGTINTDPVDLKTCLDIGTIQLRGTAVSQGGTVVSISRTFGFPANRSRLDPSSL